ncbi:MAG: hypothetical protein R6U96_02605 [Promethearchaeia archaeon]
MWSEDTRGKGSVRSFTYSTHTGYMLGLSDGKRGERGVQEETPRSS